MDAVRVTALALGAVALAYFFRPRGSAAGDAEAHRLVEAGAQLVDVRSPAEFASGHISGAVNVPVQELDQRLNELQPTDRPIVVYCRSGNRSRAAAQILQSGGFSKVHDLGAMSRW